MTALATGDQEEAQGVAGSATRSSTTSTATGSDPRTTSGARRCTARSRPDLLLTGHWGARSVDDSFLDLVTESSDALVSQHAELLPDDLSVGPDTVLARIEPYRSRLAVGAEQVLTVHVRNPYPAARLARVRLVLPVGWPSVRHEQQVDLAPRAGATLSFRVRAGRPGPRQRLAADVSIGELRLGQHAEALVDVGTAPAPGPASRGRVATVRSAQVTRAAAGVRATSRRPTIRDVAEAAGVSQSTTSRALRNQGYVAADVRDRVQRVASRLGYVPNALARHLRQRVSHSIGVLVSDLRNSFYADLAAGASRAARRAGYTVMLIDDRLLAAEEAEASEAFASMRVAGVVLTPLSARVSEYLLQQQIPVVEVDRQFAVESCDAVVVDNRVAAAKLTEHLIDLGHRRIALLVDETYWTTGRERVRGYEQALAGAGIAPDPTLMVSSGWDVEGAREVTVGLLGGRSAPTAIFAANNVLAEGVWRAATDLGLRLPEQLSIVSFDEAPWMTMVSPMVTTVRQDGVALGEAAVVRLLKRIQTPSAPISTLVFRAEVTVRGSSGPVVPPDPVPAPAAGRRTSVLLGSRGEDRR